MQAALSASCPVLLCGSQQRCWIRPGKQRDLDQAFEAVRTFQPMDKAKLAELLARSHPYGRKGRYDPFEISATFDGAKNP